MNKLDLLVRTYSKLHNYKGIPYWVQTPFRRLVRSIVNHQLPKYLSNRSRQIVKKQTDIIVSFTSFPARIDNVWQVVECMLRQTYMPKKIILWLSNEQFSSKSDLPKSLLDLENEIFEVRFVDGDIRSHKKYYYVSKEYPNSLILLIDDDLYYPTDMIEEILIEHNKYPQSVICRYGHIRKYNEKGNLLPYKYWEETNEAIIDKHLFFGSGGGTLIKPNSLYKDLTNEELFLKLTPIADDIWLNAMVELADIPIKKIKFGLLLPIKGRDDNRTLCSENVSSGQNDIQINNIREYYKKEINKELFAK